MPARFNSGTEMCRSTAEGSTSQDLWRGSTTMDPRIDVEDAERAAASGHSPTLFRACA
jgi:hypothetical protein